MDPDLRAYVRTLWKRKWWSVGFFAFCIALGTLFTVQATPMYQAQATLLVGQRQIAIEDLAEEVVARNLGITLVNSYARIITSRSTVQRAIADSGLDVSPSEVLENLQADAIVNTTILEVTYTGADPGRAQRITNAVAEAFIADIGEIDALEGDEPAVDVSLIDPAVVPTTPVSPNVARNSSLAVLIGLMGGVGIAFVVNALDTSVKQKEEVEHLGLHLLGSIPRMNAKGEDVHVESDHQGLGGEAFRKLRTSIGFLNLEEPIRTVLVTSSVPQEGKTTISLNLAVAYALGGLRTLLVEADLRRPSLHRNFGMFGTRGLTTAIVGSVPLSEAIVHTDTRNLSVMLAGAIPPNPVELLGSDQMTDMIDKLERMFDIIIIDSPPAVPVADPSALAARCDGVIVVTRAGKTDRRRLSETCQLLERAGGRMLGVVLNFLKPSDEPYDYEYYYHGDRTTPEDQPAVAGREST